MRHACSVPEASSLKSIFDIVDVTLPVPQLHIDHHDVPR